MFILNTSFKITLLTRSRIFSTSSQDIRYGAAYILHTFFFLMFWGNFFWSVCMSLPLKGESGSCFYFLMNDVTLQKKEQACKVHVYNNSASCGSFLQFQQWKVAKRKSSHTRRTKAIKASKRNATALVRSVSYFTTLYQTTALCNGKWGRWQHECEWLLGKCGEMKSSGGSVLQFDYLHRQSRVCAVIYVTKIKFLFNIGQSSLRSFICRFHVPFFIKITWFVGLLKHWHWK